MPQMLMRKFSIDDARDQVVTASLIVDQNIDALGLKQNFCFSCFCWWSRPLVCFKIIKINLKVTWEAF